MYGLKTVALTKQRGLELEVAEMKMLRLSVGGTRLEEIRNEHLQQRRIIKACLEIKSQSRPTLFLALCMLFLTMVCGSPPSCKMEDEQCEFWLVVKYRLTMMDGRTAVYPYNGKLYPYYVPENSTANAAPTDPDRVVVGDGWEVPKLVVTVNDSMPGPPIEVYEKQTVVVHVTNALISEGVTIHWHGQHQKNTPWMDGVAFVTQCPILPGQSFTYRFTAFPRGTFWYHSHIGLQRGMGLVGAFIVREKKVSTMEEHVMVLQDWNHSFDSKVAFERMLLGNFINRHERQYTKSLDGGYFSTYQLHAALINGRGRYLQANSSANTTPLSVFSVEHGQSYRFRVVGALSVFSLRVSIDDHSMLLVASDGFELEPLEVESFVVNPGERFDVIIKANQSVTNYWIRVETLEVDVVNHIGLAILRYNGSAVEDPTTHRKHCTAIDRCVIVNCPFRFYPKGSHTVCVNFDTIKAGASRRTPGRTSWEEDEIEDLFMNFGFPGNEMPPFSTINGIQFRVPTSSALTQPNDVTTFCTPEDDCGAQKTCTCSHSLNLKHGKVYQMVFTNMGKGKGWTHPIHMHGHSFHLVKMGYPVYNQTTGHFIRDAPGIDCEATPDGTPSFCNFPKWSNSSWGGNQVPGLELARPPVKDTIILPSGGYVVVRIRADNPGVWFLHCHEEFHHVDGMALMLNESFERQNPPPEGFPKCGNFS